MSDDFGTVNIRRGDRAREIEVLRQHYRGHRDALGRLIADAPTEQLAAEYQRLIASIDDSLRKLDDLEGRPATQPGTRAVPPPAAQPSMPPPTSPGTSAGTRPLSGEPLAEPQRYVADEPPAANAGARTLLIVVVGVLVLGAIGYLIWRASRERRPGTTTTGTVVEQPVSPATADTGTTTPVTTSPAAATPATSALKIVPVVADYGVVRKGTRAVRQFEATNSGTTPLTIEVARSACHCLLYDYHDQIAPGAKETITVTVDGAKAKVGTIDEQVAVRAKKGATVYGSLGVRAIIK